MPLGLTAAAAIHKRNIWIRYNNINNFDEKTSDAMKIVKYFKESGLLKKAKTIKNEVKEQKVGFFSMLLGTLGSSLCGNLLTGKG